MLSKSGIHSIRALVVLAQLGNGRYRGASVIAAMSKSPPNYLGKLLQMMSKAELVHSQKGLGGGYRLARDPADISLFDVLESIEDGRAWNRCIFGDSECSDNNPCAVHNDWTVVRDAYLNMLKTTRITDLLPGPGHRSVGIDFSVD
jgi:Rrf2 family protein